MHRGKYWNLIIRIPGLEYTGILSKILESNIFIGMFFVHFVYNVYICDATYLLLTDTRSNPIVLIYVLLFFIMIH